MAEYYDYVAESANDQINWGEIGKNISDMLNKQVEVRDQRREEINTATNDVVKTLTDTKLLGQDQNANAWWQESAGQLQEYLLLQNRLWKNGQLDNVTYKRNIENTKNNTNQLIDIFNNYNKVNDARVKKVLEGGVAGHGLFIYDNLTQFSNLNNTKVYVSPSDGNMILSQKVDKNGQIVADKNPNGIRTVAALTAAMTSEYDSFDLDKALETPVKNFGNMITTQLGGLSGMPDEDVITKINDIRNNSYTQTAIDGIVNNVMNNPDNASAIYSGFVHAGIDYKKLYTFDPNDTDPKKILLKLMPNGRYEADFSSDKGKNQKAEIEKAVRARVESMISSAVDSNLNPLLARIEAKKAQAAAVKAQAAADKEARQKGKQQKQDNSTSLFDSTTVMENVETKDANGNVTGFQQVFTPLAEKFDKMMNEGSPERAIDTMFETIKIDGARFSKYNYQRETDKNGRWVLKLEVPDYVTSQPKEGEKVIHTYITFHEPIDAQSRQYNEDILANIYNAIVTNNKVDANDVILPGNKMQFENNRIGGGTAADYNN